MGPCEHECPISILNLLSPRDDEWALAWRADCRNNAVQKAADRKNPNSLQNLPLGVKITTQKRGIPLELEKAIIRGRKRPVWVDWSTRTYYRTEQVQRARYTIV